MFALNHHAAALCGRHHVYVFPMSPSSPIVDVMPLDLAVNLPAGSTANPEKLSAIGCDIAESGKLVVAADSGKNVFVFEFVEKRWEPFASWEMPKRLVKVQFDRRGKYVVMTDKTGDVYTCLKGPKIFSPPKKILGHTSYILDVVFHADNTKIITCDRDEKIRISSFPTAYQINGYKLGHREAVVNIALVNHSAHLISMSAEGIMKMWSFYGKGTHPIASYDVLTALGKKKDSSTQVIKMSAGDPEGRVYVAVQISGFKELFVMEIKQVDKTMRLYGRVKLSHDFVDFCWYGQFLYVFCPHAGTVNRYTPSSHGGLVKDEAFVIPIVPFSAACKDMADFGTFNRPFHFMKKRATTSTIETIAPTRELVFSECGSLPELSLSAVTTGPKAKVERLHVTSS